MDNFQPKILAIAGSVRQASFNRKLLQIAASGATRVGAHVTFLDLKEYPIPIYDGDIESHEGIPENVLKMRALMQAHHGLLIASPEYNGSIAPLLKNMIDWTSRSTNGNGGLELYANKFAVLMSTSPSTYGGLKGLSHLREVLSTVGVLVLPEQLALGKAHEVFREQELTRNHNLRAAIEALGAALAKRLASVLPESFHEPPYERRHDFGRVTN
jgi:NAD(P)H-dependent FMN reductase